MLCIIKYTERNKDEMGLETHDLCVPHPTHIIDTNLSGVRYDSMGRGAPTMNNVQFVLQVRNCHVCKVYEIIEVSIWCVRSVPFSEEIENCVWGRMKHH